jgi:hypothetical protein
MDDATLIGHIERLKGVAQAAHEDWPSIRGAHAQAAEFLREFAGPNSSFLQLAQHTGGNAASAVATLQAALDSFKSYVEAGLRGEVTPARRAQLDVVSDFLEQAHSLLEAKGVHPAAPIVLVGATLEEFLRTWVENKEFSLGQRKPSLDTYAQVLLSEALITKQDMKDLTAWGGLRNHAAHGEWAEVSDKQRAALMLEGVNLFMRKYGA